MRSQAWQESAVRASMWDQGADESSPCTQRWFRIYFFVAVLFSPSSLPKQYLVILPSDADPGEEILSSARLKLGLSDRHFMLLHDSFCFVRRALKPRHFSPAVLSQYTHCFSRKWQDLQPHRPALQQKSPNL